MEESIKNADLSFLCCCRRQFLNWATEIEELRAGDSQRKKEELRLLSELNSIKRKLAEKEFEQQTNANVEQQTHVAETDNWRRTNEQQQREINELKVS